MVLSNLQINDAVHIFYENIFRIIDFSCPKKYLYTPKYPLWFSTTLKQLILRKKIAHKIYKRYPTQCNYNQFSNLRAQCKSLNKLEYNSFITKTQNSIKSNPKLFWKFIRNKRSTSTLPESMNYNNVNYCGGIDISNCFARFFSSVFNQPYYCNAVPSIENINMHSVDFNKCVLTLNDIFGELNCISTKTCPGPDVIPSIFFKECKFVLAVPLLILFNRSLSSGVFPDK
uniref:Uncharacterized protein n=1 Tax=Sipha flava TaxID=143950 RepID=A0A2S2PY62_9HEMI